ncbi:MAG: hypothetical protein H6742_13705 [Alphaproteobacteria bacterium]|nr:hypothetical protein [Alphaproteobacteria bacterium]
MLRNQLHALGDGLRATLRRLPAAGAEALLAMGVAAVAAVGFTWPLAADLSGQVIGGGELGGWLWRIWWHFQEAQALSSLDLGPLEHLRQLISLGRFPETGNILDILLISSVLDAFTDFPAHHNLKVLVVLTGNGLCAYALARSVVEDRVVALAASLVAIFNPLVIVDVNGTGLRQVLLWWVLLYPIALRRALRDGRPLDGALVGLAFTAVSAFYWFYGLFTAMASVVLLAFSLWRDRSAWRRLPRWLAPAALVAGVGVFLFLLPYFQAGGQDAPAAAAAALSKSRGLLDLPETTFGLPFPPYDAIAEAPLRPDSYEENVLASLHRVIGSSWPADYLINPMHGAASFPLAVLLVGVVPAFLQRRARPWLAVWFLFYLGTLGPFLKVGARQDTSQVVMFGEFVVRLPYTLMFQYVPGMSRMFGPYRMASWMMVACVPLVALGLSAIPRRLPRWSLAAVFAGTLAFQPYVHISGPVAKGSIPPPPIKAPLWVSDFAVPDWYLSLPEPDADTVGAGIIEMPFEQQQDLLMAYQARHGRPVYYQNWATQTAIPTILRGRDTAGGRRLQALAGERHRNRDVDVNLLRLSSTPADVDLTQLPPAALLEVVRKHGYHWLVVHESGYLYVDVFNSAVRYGTTVSKLGAYLGQDPLTFTEFTAGQHRDDSMLPTWVPQPSRRTLDPNAPFEGANTILQMSVFDLQAWADRVEAEGLVVPLDSLPSGGVDGAAAGSPAPAGSPTPAPAGSTAPATP